LTVAFVSGKKRLKKDATLFVLFVRSSNINLLNAKTKVGCNITNGAFGKN
jgi:hypothetical protein